jgi:hypothetical protein
MGYDATDEELVGIIRRLEGRGNGSVDFDEFSQAIDMIYVKMHDIQLVEDQGASLAKNKPIDTEKARPFLKKLNENQPITVGNSLMMNLELYDQYRTLQGGYVPTEMGQESPIRNASPNRSMVPDVTPYGGKFTTSAYKLRLGGMPLDEQTSPVRGGLNMSAEAERPYPRGPPLTD